MMTVICAGAVRGHAEAMTPPLPPFDFNRAPFLVIWEVTRACALACLHCRADAIPGRDPRELSTEEGFRLIDQVKAFGPTPPLFVLVQTGRGAGLEQISADECERVLNFLYDRSLVSPFGIKTTEAPHYHRVVWQREEERRHADAGEAAQTAGRRRQLRAPRSVNDGNGFVFVDHLGHICPSGFLRAQRANVRTASLAD